MIIAKNELDINTLEREIYRQICLLGCEMLKTALTRLDDALMVERDRSVYRHKGKRGTVLKTIMGEVEYERAMYECHDDEGHRRYVYLLDRELGFDTVGFVSGVLAEKITETSCELSYREAAARAKNNAGIGTTETKLLFEEQDGVWLNLQGKDRETRGSAAEMKIAIAYTGTVKTGEKRYSLSGKVACANFEGIENFFDRKEGVIAETYDVDEIETRIFIPNRLTSYWKLLRPTVTASAGELEHPGRQQSGQTLDVEIDREIG